ncbi:hypothetical protein AB834_04385 [PVC group bacterium (ex Bugula neritina AB1)]|nr:hypothetical protein AB834_04385 [PVC group bacterium (ex Bugula neritina AB1)]
MIDKFDQITEENIKTLVDQFYNKVQKDKELGPIFEGAIGSGAKTWEPHLNKMYAFWSSIMLTSGRYQGNPMQKHLDLPSFDLALFNRWLELFFEVADELYVEEISLQYKQRSSAIAKRLSFAINTLSSK